MQDARIRAALAIVGLIVLGGCAWMLFLARHPAAPGVVITPPQPYTNSPDQTALTPRAHHAQRSKPAPAFSPAAPAHIYVHVAGAVKHPWLYSLKSGSRVLQAIEAAGGPAPNADINDIDLAERVQDGEKVFIPTLQPHSAPSVTATPGNRLGHGTEIPANASALTTPPQGVLPVVLEPGMDPPDTVASNGKRHSNGKADKLTSPSQGQVDLNTADAAQLMRLPDVGPSMAAKILAFRTQAHGFQDVTDLQQITGIGPKKYAKIAPLVTVTN